jgi:hypothetical protein
MRAELISAGSCNLTHRDYLSIMTETLSIKVSIELKARLRAAAKSRQTKPSTLLREALELIISNAAPKSKPSLYDLSRDLFQNLRRKGPRDLSTNPEHLDDLGQ